MNTLEGKPFVDGIPWMDSRVQDLIVGIVGKGARLVRDDTAQRFDVLPFVPPHRARLPRLNESPKRD